MVAGGEGLARVDGRVVFVPGVMPGELVEASVLTVQKHHARALVQRVLEASPERVAPPCSVFGRCGGCTWQYLSPAGQLAAKRELVREALERLGGLHGLDVAPVVGMDEPWAYRAKAHWALGRVDGRLRLGWYAPRSHDLVVPEACLIQADPLEEVRQVLEKALAPLGDALYDERTGRGWLRSAFARLAAGTGEVLVGVVGFSDEAPDGGAWVDRLRKALPCPATVVLNVHPEYGNKLLGSRTRVLYGTGRILERVGDLEFVLSATSFFQVNPRQTAVLFAILRELAGLTGQERVLDAYCGTGALGLAVAAGAREVLGIEVVSSAVSDARDNARRNGVAHASYCEGTVEGLLPELVASGWRPDVVLLDPPRKGLESSVIATLAEVRPRRIVYTSCEPATLARDLAAFVAAGWRVDAVRPLDMFPQTAHVETVVRLEG